MKKLFMLCCASLLAACSSQTPPNQASLDGEVFYLQRIALPPAATLSVELQDVSLMDAPAVTLARQAGLQGGDPITFQTANGLREGRVIASDSVTVRSLAVSGLRVGTGYTGRSSEDALLGQNFLRHFDVEMGRDRMVLRPRGS